MRISTEEKKAEAIKRMKALGIFPQTIKQFENEGYVSISEPPVGAFFWAEGEDLDRIRQFEEKHDALVYVVIRSYFEEIGKTDAYLFVSDYVGEWETDRRSIRNPEEGLFAYVYSHDAPWCSEMGDIGVTKTVAAGLRRTW